MSGVDWSDLDSQVKITTCSKRSLGLVSAKNDAHVYALLEVRALVARSG